MVKINKSKLPQGLLIKTEKDYRSDRILQILQKDFYDKCYICEEKSPTSINVEHFRSYKKFAHLKYDWGNLFYACGHCNRIKGSEYAHLIDCTKEDPEEYIIMRFHSYPERSVEISVHVNSPESEETRELLDKVYNGAGTPISVCEAKNLKKRISDEIQRFTECVENYLNESDLKLRAVYWDCIRKMLDKESNFAGFKRSMVMQSEEWMQCFVELLN